MFQSVPEWARDRAHHVIIVSASVLWSFSTWVCMDREGLAIPVTMAVAVASFALLLKIEAMRCEFRASPDSAVNKGYWTVWKNTDSISRKAAMMITRFPLLVVSPPMLMLTFGPDETDLSALGPWVTLCISLALVQLLWAIHYKIWTPGSFHSGLEVCYHRRSLN